MQILRTKDSVPESNAWLRDRAGRYHAKSLYLPAGETPKPLYADWRAHPERVSGFKLFQVDDVAEGPKAGLFARFFQEELPGFRVEPPARDIQAELAILGLGTNGHLAFHEPGLPKEFRFGRVALHDETCVRLGLDRGTHAISFGLGAFLATKAVLLLVRGAKKAQALEAIEQGDESWPATALRSHPDFTIISEL